MKEYKHLGSYGLIIKDNSLLLIKKVGGPYDGKLDLPGGTIEFKETPEDTLKRELKEEVGIDITKYELFDASSTFIKWNHKNEEHYIHHIGIFYKILDYSGKILENIDIDNKNDDSNGAKFYDINKLKKEDLSNIVIIELNKLGYNLK